MEKEKKKRCRVEKLESVLLSLAGSIDVSCLPPTLLKLKSYSCSASKEIKGQILKLTQQPQPQCGRYQRMRRAGARSFLPQVKRVTTEIADVCPCRWIFMHNMFF
ncbi:uncharacterized protein LOC144560436 isoform X3 [Carex rostrata]